MGPPKIRPKPIYPSEHKRRLDYFEYRFNSSNETYYFFNPYTGETVFSTDFSYIERTKSMWAPIEQRIKPGVEVVMLYPEPYMSRTWGRRPFRGWSSEEDAATHIAAVCRGWLARRELSKYYRRRYVKHLCKLCGYYYFVDSYNPDPDAETSWYKPRLAFAYDVPEYVPPDPEDWLAGNKWTYIGYENGPYYVRSGFNGIKRTEHIAFLKPDPFRDSAVSRPGEIDLEKAPLATLIAFMDDEKAIGVLMTDYLIVRAAAADGDWGKILRWMHEYPERLLVQIYGLLSFAKTEVPIDKTEGILWFEAKEVFDLCLYLLDDPDRQISKTHKLFALYAFHNLLCTRAGRVEMFNPENVTVQGYKRAEALEEFNTTRIRILVRLLDDIETEEGTFFVKQGDKKVEQSYIAPVGRSTDVAEIAMLCLSIIGHDAERRELMSLCVIESVLRAVDICKDEVSVAINACKVLYNICYRCEAGQVEVIVSTVKSMIRMIHELHSGDFECIRLCRRLELAIQPDGWRGNVEEKIAEEMKETDFEEEARRSKEMVLKMLAESKAGLEDDEEKDVKIGAIEDKSVGGSLIKAESKHDDSFDDNQSVKSDVTD